MKRGKDEEKVMGMGPMFPRLHVNDTEKGGPRAPPRNKMALYEQLSIPSQRFTPLSSNTAANLVPNSVQGGGNERGMFYPHQMPPRHQSEKQYSHSDQSTPSTQVKQRKKLDEDDFTVPIFFHSFPSQEHGKSTSDMSKEKFSSSNLPYFNHALKFQKPNDSSMLEQSTGQEAKKQKGENSKGFLAVRVKAPSNLLSIEKTESFQKQTDAAARRALEDNTANSSDRLNTDDNVQADLGAESQILSDRHGTDVLRENDAAIDRRDSSTSFRNLPSTDQNVLYDLSNDVESQENESCRSMQIGTLERGDSISETSILDSIPAHDITPDDVVGIIGQKHFWKARRAIANQQRVFAVQVFELHRLIKVQRLIAASPHLLLEDTAYLHKPVKALPAKKLPLEYTLKIIPSTPKQKVDSDKPSHKKECSAENTIEKPPFPSSQNGVPPSSCKPLTNSSPAPSISSDNNVHAWPFNSPYGHQWLIPVMSPSEGLVYKPYPATGFMGPACGPPPGSNAVMGNFLTPAYGVPPPPHPQCQIPPSFPPGSPHGYFPPYGMPVMNTAAFSGSSVEQCPPMPGQISAGEANYSIHHRNSFTTPANQRNRTTIPDGLNLNALNNDVEVQGSTASSPTEKSEAIGAVDRRNVLPLFPTSPIMSVPGSSLQPPPEPERASQVIKVVPHNPRSASESVARIFQSIQEERKQYDSV